MPQRTRPLSPHLQVYRLPITAIVSIMHRMMGVALTFALILFVVSLAMIAGGKSDYQTMQSLLNQWWMLVLVWGMVYALFFHLCHGIRHLIWDVGSGFDKVLMNYYIILEMFGALAFTALSFLFVQLGH